MYAGKFTDYTGYAKTIIYRLDCRQALEQYGIEINKQGFAFCSFHREDTASMKIYQNGFHCYGCGKYGDIVSFVKEFFNIGFFQAIEKINNDFHLGLPVDSCKTVSSVNKSNKMFREINAQRHDEENKRESEREDWMNAWDCWIDLEKMKRLLAPKQGDDALDPNFVYALNKIELAAHRIDLLPPVGGNDG